MVASAPNATLLYLAGSQSCLRCCMCSSRCPCHDGPPAAGHCQGAEGMSWLHPSQTLTVGVVQMIDELTDSVKHHVRCQQLPLWLFLSLLAKENSRNSWNGSERVGKVGIIINYIFSPLSVKKAHVCGVAMEIWKGLVYGCESDCYLKLMTEHNSTYQLGIKRPIMCVKQKGRGGMWLQLDFHPCLYIIYVGQGVSLLLLIVLVSFLC